MKNYLTNQTAPDKIQMPERDLFSAVLETAIDDLLSTSIHQDRRQTKCMEENRISAFSWVFEGSEGPVTFLSVCRTLDLCPAVVRAAIKRRLG